MTGKTPITTIATTLVALTLAACGSPTEHDTPATPDADSTSTATPTQPAPTNEAAATPAATSPNQRDFTDPEGIVHLTYPANWTPGRDFSGHALMREGWRARFDDSEPVPGRGLVSFQQTVRPMDGPGEAIEMLRIGASADPAALADCTTSGLDPALGAARPDRTLGGQLWHVMRKGDAGMSQSVDTLALRSVYQGKCYAIDRVTYAIKAKDPEPDLPDQADIAAKLDAILASIRLEG